MKSTLQEGALSKCDRRGYTAGCEPVDPITWEDTINIPIHSAVRLKLRADNPGDWMTHCHILEHADGGMMTVLRVQR